MPWFTVLYTGFSFALSKLLREIFIFTSGGDEGTVILLILDMPEQVELHICCIMLPELTVSDSD